MSAPRLVRSEDIDDMLRELLAEGRDVGREAERAAVHAGEESRQLPNKPDFTESLLDEMRVALESEIVVSKPAEGEAVIEKYEQEREIAKRALMHIKTPQLREIARELGGRTGGKLEDLLERIVRAYRSDQEQIARLVVRYEAEPPPERRLFKRVFHIQESPESLGTVGRRIESFSRRYVRTGVARWFVIEHVEWTDSLLSMRGTFHYFQADAEQDEDIYRLVAKASDASASLRLGAGQTTVEIDARGTTESRALMVAFQQSSGLRWRERPSYVDRLPTEMLSWDPRSAFLVDLVQSRFQNDAIEIFNFTTAGFQYEEPTRENDEEDETLPVVKAVKLDGRHLLDSRPACELLIAGQGLVELGMLVKFRQSADEHALLPLTIRLERDHTAVMTGFGAAHPNVARQLQDLVVSSVRRGYRQGFSDAAGLVRVANQIQAKATQSRPSRTTRLGYTDEPLDTAPLEAGSVQESGTETS